MIEFGKRYFIIFNILFLYSCASNYTDIYLMERYDHTIDITKRNESQLLPNYTPTLYEKGSEPVRYNIKTINNLSIGANIELKYEKEMRGFFTEQSRPALPQNYQVKLFFENLTNNNITISPHVYIKDGNGFIKEPDINSLLIPVYELAGIEPIKIGPAPKTPDLNINPSVTKGTISDAAGRKIASYTESKSHSVSDALKNFNSYLTYQNEISDYRLQQSMSRMNKQDQQRAVSSIQFVLSNWIKNDYNIPPRSKIGAIVNFPIRDNETPITLNLNIGNEIVEFDTEELIDEWSIKVVPDGKTQEESFWTTIHPRRVWWNSVDKKFEFQWDN